MSRIRMDVSYALKCADTYSSPRETGFARVSTSGRLPAGARRGAHFILRPRGQIQRAPDAFSS